MIVLETPRLIVRHLQMDDVEALATIYADAETMRYLAGIRTTDETRSNIEYLIGLQREHGYSLWATVLKDGNRLVGRCGLLPWEIDGKQEIELAYMVARPFWRQGLATEAAIAIVDFAVHQLEAKRLVSLIRHGNTGSERVATKVGMHFERAIVLKEKPCLLYAMERDL